MFDQSRNDATIANIYFLQSKKINVIPFFNHHEGPGKTPVSSEEFQESIKPFQHETNITEGVEFLDDTIRMTDQPLEKAPMKEDQQTKF